MSSLKELTWEAHKKAEQTHVMRLLLANEISKDLYCDLVYTKYLIYATIESKIKFLTPCLPRAQLALNDWQDIGCSLPKCLASLEAYLAHMRSLQPPQLWSHAYVHYLAPLYGGQLIKKKIENRFPVSMYQFDDPASAIQEIRSCLDIGMAAEANLAFEMTTQYYDDLYKAHKHL